MTTLFLSVMLLACGGKDADTASLDPTFTNVQATAFATCGISSTCHTGATGAEQLTLDSDVAYDELVGVASDGVPGEILVISGDSANSYLMKKLDYAAEIEGQGMPMDAPLPVVQIELVRDWIDAGAPND